MCSTYKKGGILLRSGGIQPPKEEVIKKTYLSILVADEFLNQI